MRRPGRQEWGLIGVDDRGHMKSLFIFLSRPSTEPELAPCLIDQPVAGESSGRSLVPSG